jgi:hypothetical protein
VLGIVGGNLVAEVHNPLKKNFGRFCTKNEQNPHVNLNQKNGEFWKK